MNMATDSRFMEDTMRMLANSTEEIRRSTMKARMDELLYMSEERRQQSIYMASWAMHRLSYPETRTLIKTGAEILASYPEDSRRTIMISKISALTTAAAAVAGKIVDPRSSL